MTIKTKSEPSVEIIILAHNSLKSKNIDKCLKSLEKTKYSNFKITIVDQASTDGTKSYIKERYPKVNLISNKKNKSFSEGNNDVLKISNAKYCILLNDDTEQEPTWIKELVKIAEKDKTIMALQPKVKAMSNKKMFEYAGAAGGYMDIYGYEICRGRVFNNIEKDKGQYDDLRQIFWACGVAMFLRREAVKQLGYLDEFFESYFEETDLCWRMNSAGHKIFYVPKSIIYHKGSGTWGAQKNKLQKEFLLHRNSWINLLKNYSKNNWWKILPAKFVLDLITFGAFLFKNPVKSVAVLKANIWIILKFSQLVRKNKEIEKIKKVPDKILMKQMINAPVSLNYFIGGKKYFSDYVKYIPNY